MTPRSRVSTAWPVTPRRRAIGSAAAKTARQANITAATSARRRASASGLPSARPAKRIIAVMAPGPAISGIASGKAATLRIRSCVTATSAVCCLRSLRRSNTISKAIQNRSSPPAIRNAGRPTPRSRSSTSPPRPKKARMQNAISAARAATRRRSSAVMPRVTDRKIGASPGGSTVTRSVTSAEAR